MDIAIFWFRRDLRLEDNIGLYHALESGYPVLPLFIFDTEITNELPKGDPRVSFIYKQLAKLDKQLKEYGSSLLIKKSDAFTVFLDIIKEYNVMQVFANKDYEPAAIARDESIKTLVSDYNIYFNTYKDQVIFEENEVVKDNGEPYTVYTPYKNKWRQRLSAESYQSVEYNAKAFFKQNIPFPSMAEFGFEASHIEVRDFDLNAVTDYATKRDYPSEDAGSYLGPHLRFGTVSIRKMIAHSLKKSEIFTNELIWREFFMQILYHFPHVVNQNFKSKYDHIDWRNNEDDFKRWCEGETGYPLVDAGMRELNETGYMHNRVRMITASFLVKHLLVDWRWGEAYFAEKLLDYELSSNNGNWQWVAGTGCDAAPYFRVFNPSEQIKKFDKQHQYIKRWVPELSSFNYPEPMVDHKFARERALKVYKIGLGN
jgi:deoxyribodipyrimidine photo-lyase